MPLSNIRSPISDENLSRINPLLLPLPWIVVLVLCIFVGVMKFSDKDDADNKAQSETKVFPQWYLTDVEVREFNDQGSLRYQSKTPLIRHFQVDEKASAHDYTLLATPHIIFTGEGDKASWDITADEGRSDNNDDLFTLKENVIATQDSPKQGLITINTTELRVNSREQFAETDKAVTMRTAKTQLDTQGMHADIKSDRIKLLSHVKGSYEP